MKKVIIIGGGIIGCAAARFLSQYQLDILVIEKGSDIAVGATKANSGILHAGYDCKPGTLKAATNVEGLAMYHKLAKELDIPYRINGSLVISAEKNLNTLQELYDNGIKNHVSDIEILTKQQLLQIEPNLTQNITGGLRAANAGVISPYEAAIAFAENAAENGVKFKLNTAVTGINNFTVITDTNEEFKADVIINAAGVNSANIHNMAHTPQEKILPQRGQYYLLDNTQKNLVNHTIFQLPTSMGKGVLIAPTVDYNILIGPTAEEIENPSDTSTTQEGLNEAAQKAKLSIENLPLSHKITAFAGIRAKHSGRDFIISQPKPGFINAMGIDSPGLTAAPAIAARIAEMALEKLEPKKNPNFTPHRLSIKKFRELSPKEQSELITKNPAYGKVVCRCETITEAEIVESIRRPIGAKNLDAVKRRTRTQMGRCQGGFCSLRIIELLARETGIEESMVQKNR